MSDYQPAGSEQLTPVIKNIIIINVLMVLLQFVLIKYNINLDDYLALHYWQSPKFRIWQLLTHIFMHGSPTDYGQTFAHIFFNMFGLWMFGGILERILGPGRFLVFYLVCGIGAALCHLGVLTYEFTSFQDGFAAYQQNPSPTSLAKFAQQHHVDGLKNIVVFWTQNPNCNNCLDESKRMIANWYSLMVNEPTIGASGAVFGVLFAFGYLFPNTMLLLMFAIPVKAKWAVAGYALIELFAGIGHFQGDDIAHFAHLGGMLFAFILLRLWNNKIRNRFY
jgi:membrane associated rhomboid family serine protease